LAHSLLAHCDAHILDSGTVFGVKQSLLAAFNMIDNPRQSAELGFEGPFWDVEYDFVLARAGRN